MPNSRPLARCAMLAAAGSLAAMPVAASELVWARYGDADSLDPHRATSTLSMQVWDQIYDTMLAFDEEGKPQAHFAKAWTVSEDGLEYVFELQDGVVCHDGTPFDANDVKFTVDRAFGENPSLTKTSWGPIESAEVVDPLTVKITMSTPFGAFLPFLADSFSSIVCDSEANQSAEFGSSTAVGAGPFKLARWVKGDVIELERNPDYRNFGKPAENEGPPHLERLIIKTVPEPQTRLAGLRTGEIHVAEPPFDDVPAIQASGELELVVADNTGQNVFWEAPPWSACADMAESRRATSRKPVSFGLARAGGARGGARQEAAGGPFPPNSLLRLRVIVP